MSTLINGDTLHDSITIDKKSGTVVTLGTNQKYIEKNIQLTLNVQSGSVSVSNVNVTTNPSISFNSETGVITATNSATEAISATISPGFVDASSANGTATVSGSSTYTVPIATISETKSYLGIS